MEKYYGALYMFKKGEEDCFLIIKKGREGAQFCVEYNPFLGVKNKIFVPGTKLSSLCALSNLILRALEKLENSSFSQKHEDSKRK